MGATKKTTKLNNIVEATVSELTDLNRNQILCERAFSRMTKPGAMFSDIAIQHIGHNMENPANLLIRVSATMTETVHEDNNLLSMAALDWLKSIGYGSKNHEERSLLIKAARVAYPTSPEEDIAEQFFATLGMK